MPTSLGQFTVTSGVAIQLQPGANWKYIRIINKSPYLLGVNMSGMGLFDFPEMYLEDIPIHKNFTGQINILPRTDLTNAAFSPTYTLLVMGWALDENVQPQSQPLTFLSNVGNTVNVSTVQTLSNEGSAVGTLIIDAGPSVPGQVLSIWNDHFLWKVVQSTVAHQVLSGNTSGNPLQIGQAGDVSEVLGQLTIDQKANFGGQLATTGTVLNFADSGGTTREIFNMASPFYCTFPGPLSVNGIHTTIAGSTSGQVDIFEIMTGVNFTKYILVNISSSYNSTVKTYALANPFTVRSKFRAKGNMAPVQFMATGVAQSIAMLTGFSGTTGVETTVSVTTITAGGGAQGYISTTWDTISFTATGAVGAAFFIIEGE